MKFTDFVTYFNTAVTKPGQNGSEFEVHFSTHWFIEQHGLTAPDGVTQVRIQKDLGESAYGYAYLLKLTLLILMLMLTLNGWLKVCIGQ